MNTLQRGVSIPPKILFSLFFFRKSDPGSLIIWQRRNSRDVITTKVRQKVKERDISVRVCVCWSSPSVSLFVHFFFQWTALSGLVIKWRMLSYTFTGPLFHHYPYPLASLTLTTQKRSCTQLPCTYPVLSIFSLNMSGCQNNRSWNFRLENRISRSDTWLSKLDNCCPWTVDKLVAINTAAPSRTSNFWEHTL